MSKPVIRPAAAADISAIAGIYAHAVLYGTASFEIDPPDESEMATRFRALADAGFPYLVAEIDEAVCGYAYAGPYRTRIAYRNTLEDSVYIAPEFHDCFALECAAMKRVRDVMGLTNVELMVPFVRTIAEAQRVIALLKEEGLERGVNGLKVVMMCEIPSNAILADRFLEHFDGFSIGSNDMTQLTLGVDRDSGIVAGSFDERDPAVKAMLHMAIQACCKAGKYVGICGQGPSDHPDLAKWLVEEGINSISLNPDTVVETWLYLAREARVSGHA